MPAIVKANHQRFCDMMEMFRVSQSLQDDKLSELESELNEYYTTYQQSLYDIKLLIIEYGEKQKEIRHRMKQLLRDKQPGKRDIRNLSAIKLPV